MLYNINSIEEVVHLLGNYKEKSKVIAGGTDLLIGLRNEKISPLVLIDISKIKELRKIEVTKDKIILGSGVTFTQIVECDVFKENLYGLYKACRLVGSPQIRNKGTIGGNIAHNSPAADSVPPLIALGTNINLVSTRGTRKVSLEDYYTDKDNYGIKEDELIVSIEFNRPKEDEILTFSKLGLRKALAISRITISSLIELSDDKVVKNIRVASGSIGKYPMREAKVEEFLLGKELKEETIKESIEVLQLSMDERLKGRTTLPYKRKAVEGILREALEDRLRFLSEVSI